MQWAENQMKLDFAALRNIQGIHAPLHLKCELEVANRVYAVQLICQFYMAEVIYK